MVEISIPFLKTIGWVIFQQGRQRLVVWDASEMWKKFLHFFREFYLGVT
jgi:hypothetical protein